MAKNLENAEQIQFYAKEPIRQASLKIHNIIDNLETFGFMERKTHSDYEMFVADTVMSNMGEVMAGGRKFEDLIDSSMKHIRQLADLKAIPFPIAIQCHRSLGRISEISKGLQSKYSSQENFQGNYLKESVIALETTKSIHTVLRLVDSCVSSCLTNLEEAFESLKNLELASKEMEEIGRKDGFMREALSKDEIGKIKDNLRRAIMKE